MFYLHAREEELQELSRVTYSRIAGFSGFSLFICIIVSGLQVATMALKDILWEKETYLRKALIKLSNFLFSDLIKYFLKILPLEGKMILRLEIDRFNPVYYI